MMKKKQSIIALVLAAIVTVLLGWIDGVKGRCPGPARRWGRLGACWLGYVDLNHD